MDLWTIWVNLQINHGIAVDGLGCGNVDNRTASCSGLPHASKIAEVTVEADTYLITVGLGITITEPRTTSRNIKRHKASNYEPR